MKISQLLRHKFLRDTGTLQMGAILVAGGNFLSAAGLAFLLGAAKQGEFYVAVSLYSLLWFLVNLGLVSVTVSKVSAALACKEHDEAASWLAYLLKAYLVLGIIVAIAAWLILPWAAVEVFDTRREVGVFAALLALTPIVELPRIVALAGLQATRRMLPLTQVENGSELSRVFLVLLGALLTNDLRGPVIGSLIAAGLGSFLALDLYARECRAVALLPRPRQILRHFRDVPLRKGLPLGVRMGAVQNINALGTQILPTLLLQYFGSSTWVAYLRIGQRIMNVPLMFMQAINRTVLPMFSEFAGQKDMRRVCTSYFRTSLFSGLSIGAGMLAILPLLPWVLQKTFPADYVDPVWTICLILTPGFLVVAFSIANDTFYLVTGTLRVGIIFSVVGAVLSITAVALLAWRYPTVGVAWGLTVTMFWSLWHPAYAFYWYRKNVVAKGL